MNSTTPAPARFLCDGNTRPMTSEDVVVGNVVRMINSDGSIDSFADCVITKIEDHTYESAFGKNIHLSRPHIMIIDGDASLHREDFSVYANKLVKSFHVVLLASGKVQNRKY